MILGELNRTLGVDGSSCAWEGRGPSGCSMLFSGSALSLWSHSFNLDLVLYLKCLPFRELSLSLLSCGGSLSEPIMFCYNGNMVEHGQSSGSQGVSRILGPGNRVEP